ncbi:uncharacterized protein LOC130706600 isoform X6 [Balaenoptera acutorostrata]|uniref:Uncharacterized protein LOC130706600 isoform X6 n=1 Tax=Balaenoptera acutorostrata TaxID=9767 RepID=A0ABM3SZH9_BALAC|nr:uncharacterized protein LOC130706600 isoform X6 [Balaenoptera acutorostrata]
MLFLLSAQPWSTLAAGNTFSPQREQLVPPAVTHVAGQTSSHCLHPPAPLPERWCWLAARTAAAFCAVTASCHQLCSHLPQSLLPTPWSNPPTLDAQIAVKLLWRLPCPGLPSAAPQSGPAATALALQALIAETF